MIKKFAIIVITTLALTLNVSAGTDGELLLKKNEPSEIKDCSERFNRSIFSLNQGLDKILFKPVSGIYKSLPSPIKSGVSNSLDNLSNLVTIPNNILQGDFKTAGVNTGRFLINTTIGILGLFDAADHMGFTEYEKEDYGQSLAKAGVGPGCYIVLPVLGPSTVRDTVSTAANFLGGDADQPFIPDLRDLMKTINPSQLIARRWSKSDIFQWPSLQKTRIRQKEFIHNRSLKTSQSKSL